MLAALTILATSLIGFTAAEIAMAPAAGAACASSFTVDNGWHLSALSGYSYHEVEDKYFAYDLNGDCTYTTHAAADVCNVNGCIRAAWEVWMPYWAVTSGVSLNGPGDYHFDIVKHPHYNTNWGSGVQVGCTKCTSGAFKFMFHDLWNTSDGSENQWMPHIHEYNWYQSIPGNTIYGVQVQL